MENLEKRVNKREINAQKELRELRSKMLRLADREVEDAALYFREWWARKADRPSLKMFRMLKVKQAAKFMQDESRHRVSSEEANKGYIAQHFHSLLSDHPLGHDAEKRSSNLVKQCRQKIVLPKQTK